MHARKHTPLWTVPTTLLTGLLRFTHQTYPLTYSLAYFPSLACRQVVRYEPGQFYKVHHDQNTAVWAPQARARAWV